jgi:hypothetical protein
MSVRSLFAAAGVAITLLGGCEYLAQKELKVGESTVDDVRRLMGRPEMIWEERDGSQRLEYPRGPAGVETFVVEIDAQGRYRGMHNILTAENFAQVKPGMPRDDVRRLLGKPTETAFFKLKKEEVWSWKHAAGQGRTEFFNAHFDDDGRVRGTSTTPDPATVNAS